MPRLFFLLINMNKYIYAFDLSLSCSGYSIFTDDGQLVTFGSIETKADIEHSERLHYIGESLLSLRKIYPPKLVLIEKGFSRYAASTQAIFKVVGVVSYLFWDIQQIFISPSTSKKSVTGKGNSNKEAVYATIEHNYNIKFNNYDESDSFALALTWFSKKGISISTRKWSEQR